jgi:hypothetical protein
MLAPLALIVVAVLYRVVLGFAGSGDMHALHNFAPISAIALCGAIYLPRRLALILPLGILVVSDLALNLWHYHLPFWTWEILPRYAALALIVMLGWAVRGQPTFLRVFGSAVVGSIIFYLITNTGSWLAGPGYAKTLNGWLQALTTGLPGFPSTWWFYRHTFLSDIFFTSLFFACMHSGARDHAVLDPTRLQKAESIE